MDPDAAEVGRGGPAGGIPRLTNGAYRQGTRSLAGQRSRHGKRNEAAERPRKHLLGFFRFQQARARRVASNSALLSDPQTGQAHGVRFPASRGLLHARLPPQLPGDSSDPPNSRCRASADASGHMKRISAVKGMRPRLEISSAGQHLRHALTRKKQYAAAVWPRHAAKERDIETDNFTDAVKGQPEPPSPAGGVLKRFPERRCKIARLLKEESRVGSPSKIQETGAEDRSLQT
ncbi:hypothetical protein AXG93_815s1610 [Marchantia polymorpha subsp. ruderalis]|uniref:Uncharacterized protein n=1 Tax=Marchantia polymorpha subsp. ruderalis TaxID=1480154 RepID=A0A176W099_MARPO|nr:hypothetical protein AXG93_815s1610 [Marchantia polymorpha subsp. ruderalis]